MKLNPESIAIVVAGALLCFAGWHLFRFSRYIIGFILGASVGHVLAVLALNVFKRPFPPSWEPWVVLVFIILFAFIGTLLLKLVIKAVLFIAGFLFGNLLVVVYTGNMEILAGAHNVQVMIDSVSLWSLGAGLVCGILFIFFEKAFVILYTCAVGAFLIMTRLAAPPMVFYGMLITGSLVQFRMSRGTKVKNLQISEITAKRKA